MQNTAINTNGFNRNIVSVFQAKIVEYCYKIIKLSTFCIDLI